jgi:hypothetical protein
MQPHEKIGIAPRHKGRKGRCDCFSQSGTDSGGEGGIRTPDRGVSPYNGLANRRLQPLGHLSGVFAASGIVSVYGHLQELAPTSLLCAPGMKVEVCDCMSLGLAIQDQMLPPRAK